jgi:hypothetical protein
MTIKSERPGDLEICWQCVAAPCCMDLRVKRRRKGDCLHYYAVAKKNAPLTARKVEA